LPWPDCPYDVVLNTETKLYDCPFMNVKTINSSKDLSWTARLRYVLNQIDSEFVLFFLEDFFLRSPVNQEMFEEAYNLISQNEDIGYIGLKYSPERNFKNKNFVPTNRFFSRDLLDSLCRITAVSVLWRRSWLIELLDDKESPWEFEKNASIRSKQYPYEVLEINNINGVCPPVFDFEDKTYALLMPLDSDDEEESDLIVLEYVEEGDEGTFVSIEDEDEFNRVCDYIESLADEVED
jgi:hypothetical protein